MPRKPTTKQKSMDWRWPDPTADAPPLEWAAEQLLEALERQDHQCHSCKNSAFAYSLNVEEGIRSVRQALGPTPRTYPNDADKLRESADAS